MNVAPPDIAQLYDQAAFGGAHPDPPLTVSQWADRFRQLSQASSPEPGPWRTSRVPFLRDIMDDLSQSSPVERVVFMKGSQIGGPLALDTPIPTTEGWTTMGEVRVGDRVFDENGQPCWVTSVSPVFWDRECYRVRFSDGSELVADADHRWRVWRKLGAMREEDCTLTTAQMLSDYLYQKGNGNEHRYSVSVAGPLVLPVSELPLDPYLLGYWLGNGGVRVNTIAVHQDDAEEIQFHLSGSKVTTKVEYPKRAAQGKTALIKVNPGSLQRQEDGKFGTVVAENEIRFMDTLRALGVFSNKHIPRQYLRAAFSDRLALFQGLMDADGSIDVDGRCSFGTSNPHLRDQFYELAMTLGLKATMYRTPAKVHKAIHGHPVRSKESWVVRFLAYSDLPIFRLNRKRSRQRDRSFGHPTEVCRRRIVAITPAPSVPVRCIMVDSESHLFLSGKSLTVSHNTESANNAIGYIIHYAPGPTMSVQPTVEMAKRNSKQRIAHLIQGSIVLRQLVKDARNRDSGNTLLSKEFPGGMLAMVGANSAQALRSMAVRYLFLDEVDAYPGDVDGEGDPCALAIARTSNFPRRKIFILSTPTVTGRSRIERFYNDTDQRQYHLPCPHCAEMIVLEFAQLRWRPGEPRTVRYYCQGCAKPIENGQKEWMLPRGEWRARRTGSDPRTHGYHLSSLYSPVGWLSWSDVVRKYEEAGTDPDRTQTFMNTVLGQVWADTAERPDSDRLYERRENYPIGIVPRGGLVLTCGVDVQSRRLEAEIVAWGRNKESWSIDYRVIDGDPSQPQVWKELTELLDEDFPTEYGGTMKIQRMAIDSGYSTMSVYEFVRRCAPGRAMAVKGNTRTPTVVGVPTRPEVGPQGQRMKWGVLLYPLNTNIAKEELYRWLRSSVPDVSRGEKWPTGFCHFPAYTKEYFEGLCAEQLVTRAVGGRRVSAWERVRDRNEPLDCFDAETEVLTDDGWRRFQDLSSAQKLATVELATDHIEYQLPAELIKRPHDSEMVALQGRRLDILVTPNHRMVTYLPDRDAAKAKVPVITLAKDLTQRHQIKLTAQWARSGPCCITIPASIKDDNGHEIEPERNVKAVDLAAFYGWWITEGSVTQVPDTCMRRVSICQTKEQNLPVIAALLDRLPWHFHWIANGSKFIATSKQLYSEVIQWGRLQSARRVPAWIKQSGTEVIKAFIDAAVLGDGWIQKRGGRVIATICRDLADDYQELFVKLGCAPRIHVRKAAAYAIRGHSGTNTHDQYHVHENPRIGKASLDGGSRKPRFYIGKNVPYTGMVYCASVPNGTLICRRNGQVFIAGNCRIYARAAMVATRCEAWKEQRWATLEAQLSGIPVEARVPVAPEPPRSTAAAPVKGAVIPQFKPIRATQDFLD